MRPDVKHIYRAKPGARLLNHEKAQIAGEAKERLVRDLGRPCTTDEYEAFVRQRGNPAYPVWRSIRDAMTEEADHRAASYMLTNLILVEIRGDGREGRSEKAIIEIETHHSDRTVTCYSPDEVRSSPDLIAAKVEDFKEAVRGAARSLADLVGPARMKRACSEVMGEF